MLACLLFTALSATAGLVGAAQLAAEPAPPSLTFLYSLNATLDAGIDVGRGPKGTRTVIPITGGEFKGPKLSGIQPPDTQSPILVLILSRHCTQPRCRLGAG